MSTKIKALNEEEVSYEADSDTNGRPSKEAQEELSILKYNEALITLKEGRKQDAVDILEDIVYEDDLKQLSPPQQKLQLGCLKILGDLYRDGECKNLERCKIMYERAIYFDQAVNNINFWYRLGKVCYEMGDLYSAHIAFSHALHLRPGHWGCLEHMVTISYAVQDFTGCLQYCASGLAMDSGFLKGKVFRELVHAVFPELVETGRGKEDKNLETLTVPMEHEVALKEKYLEELRSLQERSKERRCSIQRQLHVPTPKMHFTLTSLSLVNVVKEVLLAFESAYGTPAFHKAVEVTWTLQDGSVEGDDSTKPGTTEESQTEEESQSQIRSRSSSDDKDNNVIPMDTSSQQDADVGDKASVENGAEGQPVDSQSQNTDSESASKKKKRDVKWWQMEGKRRSQRVRGHLMPVSPDKAKKESSFADQLKNLIPAPLLGDDGTSSERESAKTTEKSGWQKKLQPVYFGSKEEETHVKQLLSQMNGINLACSLTTLVEFLTVNVKYPWPSELRELYLHLYQKFRSYVSYPNIQTYDFQQVIKDAYSCLCFVEVVIEKFKTELSLGDKDFCKLAEKEIFYLEECLLSSEPIPKDLILRVKWATVRRLLQMSLTSNDDEVNSVVCSILLEMETDLRNEPLTVWTVNEISNLICLESVSEKAVGITKMQNSQVVTDLYQSDQYESLIGVLQSCINFSEIEKRDLSDIYYYTVALYRTDNCDCIHHCLNLINQAIRFQDYSSLSESLVLLEEIWEQMKRRFSLQDKRSIVGSLLKILVACERKPPSQESILSVPWCLLHSVMYSLEEGDPVFYLEEETVPNSVLLLQMAHECMSRTEKCCVDNGKLMLYTMKELVKVKKVDAYFAFEETKLCMEQAIFCMYCHPSKKSKGVKNLKDHNSSGTNLAWEMCPTLFEYYCPDELPEFDSLSCITAPVETIFQRFLEIMPQQLNPVDRQKKVQMAITKSDVVEDLAVNESFPKELKDIYYLIGDYYFKTKEWSKAVTYYIWDLSVNWSRFDSWAAIALCLGESINTTLNTADSIEFKDLLSEAKSTAFCFKNALKLDPANIKLRIEFGSFVYAMHAYCSRLMKQQQATDIDMEKFNMIETAKDDFLKSSCKCFELIAENPAEANDSETAEEELWIHHYMLGKINEKMKEDAEEVLKQYEVAGKLLHDQGAPYPPKMNYYSPPELAIEALEIYYRVHASILNLVETEEYSMNSEKLYLQFIRRQENSPFVKLKQSKGDDSKRGRKAAEDAVSKKDMAEITSLVNHLVTEAEKLVESGTTHTTTSTATSTTTTEDETSTDSQSVKSVHISKPTVHSFSLTEFRKRLQEKEEREEKLATEAKKVEEPCTSAEAATAAKEEDIYEGLQLESNPFYPDFKDVKYGAVIALCLKAMEECISRYPSHFKSYYRLAHSYMFLVNDAKRAKEYLMGSPILIQRKIAGLFGERKPTNFFNGIWRNPIDDIDRPGSFSYHMNKSMQLLLNVLSKLNDHQLLADIGIYLTKVPDNEKKYLSNPDREMFCQQAWSNSLAAIKRKTAEAAGNINELGVEIFDTYMKFQKHNPRGYPPSGSLHDLYRMLLTSQGVSVENVTVEHALRYFSAQHLIMKQNPNRPNARVTGAAPSTSDPQRPGGDGGPPRKRGRRNLRQASQETAPPTLPTSQDFEAYGAAFAAAFNSNLGLLDRPKNPTAMLPLSYLPSSTTVTSYPTMNIDPLQAVLNPLLNMKHLEAPNKKAKTPPPVHDTVKITKTTTNAPYQHSNASAPQNRPVIVDATMKTDKQPSRTPTSSEQTRPKDAARKTSKQESSKDANKYPPDPPAQQLRLNTSPYKAQNTAVEQPPQFSYNKKSGQSSSNQSNERKIPPAAHCHTTPKRTPTNKSDGDESEVEVIDLTVKSPEKDKAKAPADALKKRALNVVKPRNTLPNPNPPYSYLTPKPRPAPYVDLRSLAMNPVPGFPSSRHPAQTSKAGALNLQMVPSASTTKTNVSTVKSSVPSPNSSTPSPSARAPSPRYSGTIPISTFHNIIKGFPKVSPTVSNPVPVSKSNTISITSPTFGNPKPSTSNPRPPIVNRNPENTNPPRAQYSLPPKKKHRQMMISTPPPPPNNDDGDDDVERGISTPSSQQASQPQQS